MIRKLAITLLSSLGVVAAAEASPEADFWKWFQAHQSTLLDYEADQERIFDQLLAELHKVDQTLTFEFGPKRNGKREFVISADGIREAFPKVEALYAAAPTLPQWTITKFRPRRKASDIQFGDKSVQAAAVSVILRPRGEKVALTIIIPDYNAAEHQTYASIGYLLLDDALGEYDVETRVGEISFQAPSGRDPQAKSLQELPAFFDAHFAGRRP